MVCAPLATSDNENGRAPVCPDASLDRSRRRDRLRGFRREIFSIVQRDASINRSALTYLELAGLTSGCCPLDGFVRRENGEHGGQIPLGAKGAFALHVRPEHLANQFKDAMLPQVLATPIMILIMENAALKLSGRFWNWVRAQSVPQ